MYGSLIFGSVFAKATEKFLEPAESAYNRTKKSLQKKEFGDVAIVLDIWNAIHEFSDTEALEVFFVLLKYSLEI